MSGRTIVYTWIARESFQTEQFLYRARKYCEIQMTETARVLLVEDSPSDAKLVEIAVEELNWINKLDVAEDGESAIAYLESKRSHPELTPHLILLDLNMPRMNGFQVLDWLKADQDFKLIPVVVLTTSSSPEDVNKAYQHSASSFISKPSDFSAFVDSLHTLEEYWFKVSRLPSTE